MLGVHKLVSRKLSCHVAYVQKINVWCKNKAFHDKKIIFYTEHKMYRLFVKLYERTCKKILYLLDNLKCFLLLWRNNLHPKPK
jgi:hypothetical protein